MKEHAKNCSVKKLHVALNAFAVPKSPRRVQLRAAAEGAPVNMAFQPDVSDSDEEFTDIHVRSKKHPPSHPIEDTLLESGNFLNTCNFVCRNIFHATCSFFHLQIYRYGNTSRRERPTT